MILDAQNLHTFSQSRYTPGLQLSFRRHFLVWSCTKHMKLVLCSSVDLRRPISSAVPSFLATLLLCVHSLND